ncbi:CHAT domain-containing protein [Pseudomonas sp. B21-036]|uniref:CHAT domain-containing protein n=1 Tax=Pseudomonas sp. B21-036 TaxID=2895485 RepID=UPI002160FAE9|nr:CHAT domain-containing protein [Pseudomonas sp. B21-036]UVL50501.1 CHAT domain-containing protein [Pseudomonas sp. B21-036]
MDIYSWNDISPSNFKKYLLKDGYKKRGQTPTGIYNTIMKMTVDDLGLAISKAGIALEVFTKKNNANEILLFLELLARCYFMLSDLTKVSKTIRKITKLAHPSSKSVALELTQLMISHPEDFGISYDNHPNVFKEAAIILHHYNEKETIAELHLKSAIIYSHHGATQAAYRNIADAERLSDELQSLYLKAKCYDTATIVSCADGDFDDAIKFGRLSLRLYRETGMACPARLYSNIGMAHMNKGHAKVAAKYFGRVLNTEKITTTAKVGVMINMIDCFRRLADFDKAQEMIKSANEALEDQDFPEESLGLSISAAKVAAEQGDINRLVQDLKKASTGIDEMLKGSLRLHHRREVRARYFVNMESLLSYLPEHGEATASLPPLLAIRGNAMADWLAILEWAEKLKGRISDSLEGKVNDILLRIRDFGAPHIMGFQEKYDDAWEVRNPVTAWDELSQICRELKLSGLELPLDHANTCSQLKLCQSRLSEGHCLVFTTKSEGKTKIWAFIAENYWRTEVCDEIINEWHAAQLQYATENISRATFTSALNIILTVLAEKLDPIIEKIAHFKCRSVRYISDSRLDLPMTQLALRNPRLSSRMLAGEFHVRTVPCLTECKSDNGSLKSVVAISDPGEDLVLAPFEASAFADSAGLKLSENIVADSKGGLTKLIGSDDIVIVSTHGSSLELFTDAYFAKLGSLDTSHVISVDSLQRSAPEFKAKLVILNACHSGSKSTRNYQKSFKTNDFVTIPTLFLLNRKSISLASDWKVSDTASFMISCLMGENIKDGFNPYSAAARTISQLPNLTLPTVLSKLKEHLPESAYTKVENRLSLAPEKGMFLHPYFTAGLAIYGLL